MVQFGKSAQCEKIAKLPLLLDTDTGMFTTLQADTTATSACNAVFVCSINVFPIMQQYYSTVYFVSLLNGQCNKVISAMYASCIVSSQQNYSSVVGIGQNSNEYI